LINIPNILSFGRLLAVPIAVWLMLDREFTFAFWLFVIAGLTDAIDGFLAKRYGWETELGSYLDPLADKALLVSVFVVLGWIGHIPLWLTIMVVFRDLMIVGGALVVVAITGNFKADPMYVSKLNTTLQIALAAAVLAKLGLDLAIDWVTWALIAATGITTFASGLAYLVRWTRILGAQEEESP
jgi:cardiolipin synthase (CMP-forming)